MVIKQKRTTRSQRLKVVALGVLVIGSCILWQLHLMKCMYLEKERYHIESGHNINNWHLQEHENVEHIKGITKSNINGAQRSSDGGQPTPAGVSKYDVDETPCIITEKESTSLKATKAATKSESLLNLSLIRNTLLREAPWAESHGANHLSYLGAGMLYYSMAYSFRSQTIVVLGSGGGFVPRVLRQAQRDLWASGIRPERKGGTKRDQPSYKLYLVDAHLASAGWGSTFYAENENTTMRKEFADINYVFQLTDDAYENYFRPMYDNPRTNFTIDYLHVDADHGFEQSWKDFDNYSQLLSDRAVISFHDTCYDNVTRSCHAEGVPETIEKLRTESHKRGLQMIDMHYLYRGIAFAFRESAPALETPRDRRINFCVNNADLINVTSDGFTKNGRVGSLPTLGDFMNCTQRYNETELKIAKLKMETWPSGPPNGIMAVPCPVRGFRRNSVSGRCEKCIPGLSGENCHKSKYGAVQTQRHGVGRKTESGDEIGERHHRDVEHLVRMWLRSHSSDSKSSPNDPQSSRPRSVLEIGQHAWKVPKPRNSDDAPSSSWPLLFDSLMTSSLSSSSPSRLEGNHDRKHYDDAAGNVDHFNDIIVVDPLLVTNPIWIDPIVSRRYRFLPCTLKDAIDYDEDEKKKNDGSRSSALDLDTVDTVICLSCDDLVTMSSPSITKEFLDSTFPTLQTMVLGLDANERSNEFLRDLVRNMISVGGLQSDSERVKSNDSGPATWLLDRNVTLSLGDGSYNAEDREKILVLLTRSLK